ncbi:MAG: NUDIX hydrolase [Candidatus Paceibacterota bacterium]
METKLKEMGDEKKCPIAVMMRDGKILTGYRHYTPDKWKKISVWTTPGGRSDLGETLYDTLKREVQEEVGITEFEIVDFIGEVAGAKEGDIVPMFFCTTKQDYILMEPEKFSEWRWVSKDEYINNGEYSGFNSGARKIIVNYLQNQK